MLRFDVRLNVISQNSCTLIRCIKTRKTNETEWKKKHKRKRSKTGCWKKSKGNQLHISLWRANLVSTNFHKWMKVLNGLPLVDVAYFQFPFVKLSKPLWHSTGSRFLSRKARPRLRSTVARLSKYAQLVSWIKVYPSDVKHSLKRVAIEISTNVTRVTRSQRLIHPLSFSILLSLLNRNGTTECIWIFFHDFRKR